MKNILKFAIGFWLFVAILSAWDRSSVSTTLPFWEGFKDMLLIVPFFAFIILKAVLLPFTWPLIAILFFMRGNRTTNDPQAWEAQSHNIARKQAAARARSEQRTKDVYAYRTNYDHHYNKYHAEKKIREEFERRLKKFKEQ